MQKFAKKFAKILLFFHLFFHALFFHALFFHALFFHGLFFHGLFFHALFFHALFFHNEKKQPFLIKEPFGSENSRRFINTASATEARKPITDKSVGGWKNYKTLLEPALRILKAEGNLINN